MKKYKFVLQGVGNPDFRQFADIAPKKTGSGTLAEIREIAREYIEEWDLGGGNFIGDIEGGLSISYNGRLWDEDKKEIVI